MEFNCKSCGAQLNDSMARCPYCGTLIPEGAQREYMQKLENVRRKLDELHTLPQESVKAELRHQGRRMRKIILAALLFSAAALLRGSAGGDLVPPSSQLELCVQTAAVGAGRVDAGYAGGALYRQHQRAGHSYCRNHSRRTAAQLEPRRNAEENRLVAGQYRHGGSIRYSGGLHNSGGKRSRAGNGDLSGADEVFQRGIHRFCSVVLPDPELDKTATLCLGRQIDFRSAENSSRYGDIPDNRCGNRHTTFEKHFAKEFHKNNPGADMLMCLAAFVDEFGKNGDFLIFAICNRNKWCYIIRTQSGGCSSVG